MSNKRVTAPAVMEHPLFRVDVGDELYFYSREFSALLNKKVIITSLPDEDYHFYGVKFVEKINGRCLDMAVRWPELHKSPITRKGCAKE